MMYASDQVLAASSWQGRLCRSLPSEVNIFKSLWIAALAEADKVSWKQWCRENAEPYFEYIHILSTGWLIANYTDRYGNYRRSVALGVHVSNVREEFSKVTMKLLLEPNEIQEFYNAVRFLLRHDARKDKTLIPGFSYTGTNPITRSK